MSVSRPSKDKAGMRKNNAHLNFGFLLGLINGIIDDKLYVPPNSPAAQGVCVRERVSPLTSDGSYSSF